MAVFVCYYHADSSFSVRKHARSHIRCCGSGHSNMVCINHCGGVCVGMAQFRRSSHQIHTVGNHGGSRSMPEGMGMDVWQIICGAELVQPIGNTVRVHDCASPLVKRNPVSCQMSAWSNFVRNCSVRYFLRSATVSGARQTARGRPVFGGPT